MNGTTQPTPYARALALCPTDAARSELDRVAAAINLGATSPEWDIVTLVAESMRIFGTRDAEQAIISAIDQSELRASEGRQAMMAALVRLEKKRAAAEPNPPPHVIVVASVALLTLSVLVAWAAPWPWPAPVREMLVPLPEILAAFSLGAVSGLGYFWLAPLVVELRRRFGR
jgi:hypothetical protein